MDKTTDAAIAHMANTAVFALRNKHTHARMIGFWVRARSNTDYESDAPRLRAQPCWVTHFVFVPERVAGPTAAQLEPRSGARTIFVWMSGFGIIGTIVLPLFRLNVTTGYGDALLTKVSNVNSLGPVTTMPLD